MEVTIEEVTIDPKIVDRTGDRCDFVTVQTYAEHMENGTVFPPVEIVSDGDTLWLVDGQHRIEAAKEANLEKIEANVTHGDRWDALEMSCGTNDEHGRPRTNEEKRQSVLMLLEGERWSKWSNHKIAEKCKVSDVFVGKMKGHTTNVCSMKTPSENHTGDIPSMETPMEIHTANVSSIKTERTFIHHKTGQPTTMNVTNIGSNNKEKAIQQIKEKYSKPPLKYLLAEYASLLTKANITSKTMVANHDEYDIRAAFQNDDFLRSGVSKAIAVNDDFIEGVKNGFQSKSD